MNPSSCNTAPPNPEQAEKIARELCADALAWSKTLYVSVTHLNRLPDLRHGSDHRAELEKDLFAEILAYVFCRLNMQATAARIPNPDAWVRSIKQQCETLKIRMNWRRKNRRLRLPGPNRASTVTNTLETAAADQAHAKQVTKQMFEQFCQCTGLNSKVLVGKGENLAALVFYIAVHGLWSNYGTLTQEQVHQLLRTAQKCHEHLDQTVSRWLRPTPIANTTRQLPS